MTSASTMCIEVLERESEKRMYTSPYLWVDEQFFSFFFGFTPSKPRFLSIKHHQLLLSTVGTRICVSVSFFLLSLLCLSGLFGGCCWREVGVGLCGAFFFSSVFVSFFFHHYRLCSECLADVVGARSVGPFSLLKPGVNWKGRAG